MFLKIITSDISNEVKVVVKGELPADSTASRKLFPPVDLSCTPAEATASRKLFPLDNVGLTEEPDAGSLEGGFAEELTKEVSLMDFIEADSSFPKVVSLICLTEEPCPLPGGDLTEEPLPGGDFTEEAFPGGGDLTKETWPLLGGDLGDLTKELLGFLTAGSSRKLLPLEAAGFDLIIVHLVFVVMIITTITIVFFYGNLCTWVLSSLGFLGCWLVNQLFLEMKSSGIKCHLLIIVMMVTGLCYESHCISHFTSCVLYFVFCIFFLLLCLLYFMSPILNVTL